jgi:hypothetical protein
VPTPQPTTTPIIPANISISMSTEISNITAVEFNATAFSSAVIDVAAAVVPAPSLPSLQVVVTSDPSVTATATNSKRRRLQAVANSVTVAYDVRNLPDTTTATALQQRLTSADGDTSLLNSYKALSNTAATAATTTAIKAPVVPPVHTSAPVGVIAGSVIGGVTVLVSAAVLTVWCQKRRVATRRREQLRKAVADDRSALYSRSSSSSKRLDSDSSFTSGSAITTAAPHPLQHGSAHKFGSMLQAIDSDTMIPVIVLLTSNRAIVVLPMLTAVVVYTTVLVSSRPEACKHKQQLLAIVQYSNSSQSQHGLASLLLLLATSRVQQAL